MIKNIFVYIASLSVVVLAVSLIANYSDSKNALEREIIIRGESRNHESKKSIINLLEYLKDISRAISTNPHLVDYLENPDNKSKEDIEKDFYFMYKNMKNFNAIRIIGLDNNIKIYVANDKILSAEDNYKEINLMSKAYYRRLTKLSSREPLLSEFELQQLPGQEHFGTPIIRTVTSLFNDEGSKIGYLIVNFDICMIIVSKKCSVESLNTSFIAEINNDNPKRDGIFISHEVEEYGYADQRNTGFRLQSVYNSMVYKKMKERESGHFVIDFDYYFFDRIYLTDKVTDPYIVVGTIIDGDEYFGSLDKLKRNLFIFTFIVVGIILLSGYLIRRQLLDPIDHINHAMKLISQGNFKYRLEGSFPSELESVVETVNMMTESIENQINVIRDSELKISRLNRLSDIGILAAGIGHELNSPLNSIIILTSLLEEYATDENRADIMMIKSEAMRCTNIIKSLRSLSQQKNKALELYAVSLKDIIDDVISTTDIKPVVKVYNNIDNEMVLGEKELIFTIFKNLLKNALEAMVDGGEIKIYSEISDENITVIFVDNGPGIDKKILSKIPLPFSTTKSSKGNMGLGLLIVYKIIEDIGGNISIKSEPGVGTTFILNFRRAK